MVGRYLDENKREGETATSAGSVQAVLPTFGWGNRLTLFRGLAISMVAGFLFSPWPNGWLAWLPMLLYTTADIADYLDGYLARITNHATALGERLDMEYDGLGMLIVSLLAVWYGQLPWWYLILGFARYLFVFGLWVRARRGLPSYDLPPSVHRRVFAGLPDGVHEFGTLADYAARVCHHCGHHLCYSHRPRLFARLVFGNRSADCAKSTLPTQPAIPLPNQYPLAAAAVPLDAGKLRCGHFPGAASRVATTRLG